MNLNQKNVAKIRGLMLFAGAVILAVIYSKDIAGAGILAMGMLKPFLIGGAIAFVLNIPLGGIEKLVFAGRKGKYAERCKRPVSIILTLLSVVFVLTFVVLTVVPQLARTLVELGNQIPVFFNETISSLEKLSAENPEILAALESLQKVEFNWKEILNSIINFLKNGVGTMVLSTFNMASNIVSGFVNGFIALIFAIYILSQKEKLGQQCRKVCKAYLSEKRNSQVCKVFSLLYQNFSRFIAGQCLEAVILGTMFVAAMLIFRFPYALLVGVLIAFTALIPIVGAFIGCVVGAFLIMINDPIQAVWFIILFLVLQQIEGNLIYPHVVGNSVGLPSIWVLAAVSLGGSMFGVVGMLVFIPLVSTAYALLKENVNERNRRKLEAAAKPPAVSE